MDDDLEYELGYLSAYDLHPFKDTDNNRYNIDIPLESAAVFIVAKTPNF